jgi:renalase
MDVVIVGAGLAGASCALVLSRSLGAAAKVRVLDKARRPGGRMATKHDDGRVWDTGAQFYTVRSEEFAAEAATWQAREWCRGFGEKGDGFPRWVGARGMNGLVADMWARLPYAPECSAKVEAVTRAGGHQGFSLKLAGGGSLSARHVVLTCPVPQALALVSTIAHPGLKPLELVRYAKTISLQVVVDERARLRDPGGLQKPCASVHFVASSSRKGICAIGERETDAWTVHMDPDFSEEHFGLSDDELKPKVIAALAAVVAVESIVQIQSIHRWRYAIPTVLHPEQSLECEFDDSSSLLFCGDAFQESRVEGAFRSGAAAGRRIASRYKAAL